jgi:hypothetical protein
VYQPRAEITAWLRAKRCCAKPIEPGPNGIAPAGRGEPHSSSIVGAHGARHHLPAKPAV